MDPNQQSNSQPPTPEQQPSYGPPATPQVPSAYTSQQSVQYDPNYLDSIAPAPARSSFLSGTFGKLFWGLIALFVLGVSLIIAFSGKDQTADLQQVSVRLDNFSKTTKTVEKNLKSSNLKTTNSTFMLWLTDNQNKAEDLLKSGGVNKTSYSKDMVRSEKAYATKLDDKFEDSRLAGTLNRVYASTMAAETQKIINMLNTMSKRSQSSKIRAYAKDASKNLSSIQKQFEDYVDDGN